MNNTNFEPGRKVSTALVYGVSEGFNAFVTGMLAAGAVVLGGQSSTQTPPARRPR